MPSERAVNQLPAAVTKCAFFDCDETRGDDSIVVAARSRSIRNNMSYELPPNTKIIFLVGAPRSGTTWLQLLLSASPLIASAVETQFFSLYGRSLFAAWQRDNKHPVGLDRFLGDEKYIELLREFASNVMARMLASKPGATIVLEKSPDHALYWRDILLLFPNAYFLHIIRDPRAVVTSLRAASQSWADWQSPSITRCAEYWVNNVTAAREIRDATPNYLEIRYRDLKQDGVRTLQSVFDWCGVDLSKAEVENILREHEIGQLRSSQASNLAKNYGSVGEKFFRKGEIESWRSELSRRQLVLVERVAGTLMDELGYVPVADVRGRWGTARTLPTMALGWLCNGLSWRLQKYRRLRKYGNVLSSWG